ncbi:MAG: response regulator [Acidobacteriota bacterium]
MNHNIMIVDDDASVLRALERQLKGTGHNIIACGSADEALVKLGCFEVSLLISDNLMPGMTGLELLKVVRHRFPQVVRILLTAHADLETALGAINQGEIFRFLLKPWDLAALLSTVIEGLKKHEKETEGERLANQEDRRRKAMADLEMKFPGITDVDQDDKGMVILS